jgi:hypothetical protein
MSWNKYKQVFVVTFGYLLLVSSANNVHALFCDPANITLSTQAMVDNFQQDHGPCDWVGSLTIRGADITNLRGLEGVVQSNGNVLIKDNPELLHLAGLEKLVTAGGDFEITDNASLTQIDGLISLEYVGRRLRIERNPNLENLNGLASLRTVKSFFYLERNDALKSLQGLSSFEVTLSFNIKYNGSLETLDGLDSLTGVDPITGTKLGLRIFGNPKLLSLTGLENIVELRELFIQGGSLENLEGLSGLHTIDMELIIQLTQTLESLDGLDSLESVGEVSLVSNAALTSLGALYRVSELDQLVIRTNPMLQNLDGLDSLLEVAGNVLVGENASGCNCILQILEPGSGMFVLNPALTDAWFNPLHNGQGFFINLYPDLETIFVGWFTFETADRESYEDTAVIGEPYHRWLTATGDWIGVKATFDVTMTSGGVFDSGEPVVNSIPENYGTVTIIFHTCDSATLSYDLYGIASGSTPIVRVASDNVVRCKTWSNFY